MRLNTVFGAISIATVALASSAHGANKPVSPPQVQFLIGSQLLAMPIPAGFCLPSGAAEEMATQKAGIDARNYTVATFVSCTADNPFALYILVKTPIRAWKLTFSKTEVIQGMAHEMEVNREKIMADGDRIAEDAYKKQSGREVKIPDKWGPAGHDDDCVYLGGSISYPPDPNVFMAAACSTVVGQKMVAIDIFDARTGADWHGLKDRLKPVVLSIHPVAP